MRFKLNAEDKRTIRKIAAQAYLDNDRDPEKAIAQGKIIIRQIYNSILLTILVGVAIRFLAQLIWYWFKNNVLDPSENPLPGEPR